MGSPPECIDLSLNEVEALALKAARGAGLDWGVAEDAGRAAAWQARHVGDWAEAFVTLLGTPTTLLLAAFLADGGLPDRVALVALPIWLLPGLLTIAARTVAVQIGGAVVHANPGETPTTSVPLITIAHMQAAGVSVAFAPAPLPPLAYPLIAAYRRSVVPLAAWRRLDALAQLTYVPASAHSRLTGAGAGLLDA